MYLANCKINYGCMTYLHIEPLLTINEVMNTFYLYNEKLRLPIYYAPFAEISGSCLKPMHLGLQLGRLYIAAIWRNF